ncbi:MAG: ATP synthase F0 subunit B [Acidobacteriota bacterium]|nr:ATP synthase F0 subunit B [Acidobacteriota bacterium]
MQLILQQLGTLLLESLPTAALFLVLVFAYQILVQGPLSEVLRKRKGLTSGAMEAAEKAIKDAEARAAEYDEKLRHARAEIFKLREQRMKQWAAEKDKAVESARGAAQDKVAKAREILEADAASARKAIEAAAIDLGRQVVHAVLPAAAGGTR